MEERDHIEAAQDEIMYRRIAAWELRQVTEDLARLKANGGKKQAWLVPALGAMLLTGAMGYIGIVHQTVLRNTGRLDYITGEQQRREHIVGEVDELRQRCGLIEATHQQIPFLVKQVSDLTAKVDRALMRPSRIEDR